MIDKKEILKELSSLARKQKCFNDMFVYNFTETLEVEIYDNDSYIKIANLLPSISMSTLTSSYNYNTNLHKWYFSCMWEDEIMIEKLVEVVCLIVDECMKFQSEFNRLSLNIYKLLN